MSNHRKDMCKHDRSAVCYYIFNVLPIQNLCFKYLHVKIEVAKKKCCILYEVSIHDVTKNVCSLDQEMEISQIHVIRQIFEFQSRILTRIRKKQQSMS